MARVLIIDDDEAMCGLIASTVTYMNHEADYAMTLAAGLEKARSGAHDVVFLDVRMPDGDGMTILPEIRESDSAPEVIIITGGGTPDGAEIAIRNGAWDYVQKPMSAKMIMLVLNRVFQYRTSLEKSKPKIAELKLSGIIGSSRQIRLCIDTLSQAANSDANVLISGETGTGKELFAKAIHDNSRRSSHSLVVVDCAALPETLVESTLFGHEKGAYTGAEKPAIGLVRQADRGTLFLDEVGELDLSMQKAFLRVLQERRFRAVGGRDEISSNFRLIAATNRDLEAMVEEGTFRSDLLYRLKTISLEIPPLREHLEDIRELILYYTERLCRKYGLETKGFSPDFFEALSAYGWPGNVRELVNAVEGAISEAHYEPILFPQHLPDRIRIEIARSSIAGSRILATAVPAGQRFILPEEIPPFREFRSAVLAGPEKNYFEKLMAGTRGNITEACRVSGLSRTRLYTLMKKHGVHRLGWSPDS